MQKDKIKQYKSNHTGVFFSFTTCTLKIIMINTILSKYFEMVTIQQPYIAQRSLKNIIQIAKNMY